MTCEVEALSTVSTMTWDCIRLRPNKTWCHARSGKDSREEDLGRGGLLYSCLQSQYRQSAPLHILVMSPRLVTESGTVSKAGRAVALNTLTSFVLF